MITLPTGKVVYRKIKTYGYSTFVTIGGLFFSYDYYDLDDISKGYILSACSIDDITILNNGNKIKYIHRCISNINSFKNSPLVYVDNIFLPEKLYPIARNQKRYNMLDNAFFENIHK